MESMTFVLFGATGDLAKRKIFPALYNLYIDQKVPSALSVIGLGIDEMTLADFHQHVKDAVTSFSRRDPSEKELQAFLEKIVYTTLDAKKEDDYIKLLQLVEEQEKAYDIPGNRLFYLSVAPMFFDTIALHIKKSGLGSTKGFKRLIIEKPFGHDVESAQELNNHLNHAFEEEEIYRIDHYLGKPMVQNLEALEFANPVLQALWNNQYIANVQITASETVGVEKRAGYYDGAGAIRDMFQNHMLQLLMMTAMHLPKKICASDIRDEKRKVIESLRPLTSTDIQQSVVRGQYGAGEIKGKTVPAYTDEPGVKEHSQTDTFVAARLWIDNEFWQGVPFYIRTGKRLSEKSTRIVIEFKNPLKDLYVDQNQEVAPNLFVIQINPNESMSLQLNSKNPLKNGQLETVSIHFSSDQDEIPEAYERLIYDVFRGDSTFFAHWKEVELAWKWIDPLLQAFQNNTLPLNTYEAGTNGPKEADELVQKDGFTWWTGKDPAESKLSVNL
ncbi:glucose-6-phosphate dehydrogenase [Priestia koreensis]|uniref:glucose-6-phosphate dehydrogenase n=1 Tax=Priestia koreensis TaxID=284581 RepID=UPI003457E7E5